MYKIILVDDEKLVLESLERRIEWDKSGFEVIGKASNGLEGLDLIRKLKPDVVFTDIRMPIMGGLDLIRIASEEFPEIRFVVISGHSEFEYAKQAIVYGVLGFCVKPFEEEEIYSILNKAQILLNEKKESQLDYFYHAMINYDGNVQKKTEAFEKLGISEYEPKWIFAVHGKPNIEFLKSKRCFFIPSDKYYEMYLITQKDGDEIVKQAAVNVKTGLSNVFYGAEEIDFALEQAKIASYHYFINNKNMNKYGDLSTTLDVSQLLKDLHKAYSANDVQMISKVFSEMQKFTKEDKITIKDAFRFYNAVVTLLSEGVLPYCDHYAHLVSRYDNCTDMFISLEDNVKKAIIDVAEDSSRSDVMQKILYYINEHYNDPNISLSKISSIFGFNPNYTSQLFKKSEAENFTAYLTRIRINRAKDLLKNTNLQVGEIGEKVGYTDYFYFAKVFKKQVNLTPGDYRLKRNEEKINITKENNK